jgi:hypothetical protein
MWCDKWNLLLNWGGTGLLGKSGDFDLPVSPCAIVLEHMSSKTGLVSPERMEKSNFLIRGQKVMLDPT